MVELISAATLISLLHGLIPSHWLPILALKKQFGWSDVHTLKIAFGAGLAHVISTILLGIILGYLSHSIATHIEAFTQWVAPIILIGLGVYFIWRHNRHHHFHLSGKHKLSSSTPQKVIGVLMVMMFLSPCLEIEALFLSAGMMGWKAVAGIALIYAIVSCSGITLWIALSQKGLSKMNWHRLEHNSGLISGGVLIVLGILSFILHME